MGHVNRYTKTGQMPSLEEARADLSSLPIQLRAAAARTLVAEGLVDPWCALSLAAFGLWTVDPTDPEPDGTVARKPLPAGDATPYAVRIPTDMTATHLPPGLCHRGRAEFRS